MPPLNASALRLPLPYLKRLREILHRLAPHADVWAYGSRVTGTGHEASDLDLVLRNPDDLEAEDPLLFDLKDAFAESDLPIRVDVMDWARVPPSFRNEIERAFVVVQERRESAQKPATGMQK